MPVLPTFEMNFSNVKARPATHNIMPTNIFALHDIGVYIAKTQHNMITSNLPFAGWDFLKHIQVAYYFCAFSASIFRYAFPR